MADSALSRLGTIDVWSNLASARDRIAETGATDRELPTLLDRMSEEAFRGHRGRALNLFTVGLMVAEEKFLEQVRRRGLLRSSKYDYSPQVPSFIVAKLLQGATQIPLSLDSVTYLSSVRCLLDLAPAVGAVRKGLVRTLLEHRHTAVKSALATVDLIFMMQDTGHELFEWWGHDGRLAEDIAEGFSYLFHLHVTQFGVEGTDPHLTDAKGVAAGYYYKNLCDAADIRLFHEVETLVDVLGYRAKVESDGSVSVSPPTPEVEKAVRLGYIQEQWRSQEARQALPKDGHPSLRQAGEQLYEVLKRRFVRLLDHPIRRFRFEVPPLQTAINDRGLFREELGILYYTSRDHLVGGDELLEFDLGEHVTLWDILKVRRLFNLTRWYVITHLLREARHDPELLAQSIVPSFEPEAVRTIIGQAVPPEKIEPILRTLTWNPDREPVFDVQYQPFVRAGQHWHVPLNVFGASNIVRNILYLRRRRLHDDDDAVTAFLRRAFELSGLKAWDRVPYVGEGASGEVDVLARVGHALVACECKNALLPCSPHELRTTYDHILKASDQLTRFVDTTSEVDGLKHLGERLHEDLRDIQSVFTCIVTGNWMFSGGRIAGHPVRGLHELAGFVKAGWIGLGGVKIGVRPRGPLREESLKRYLRDDSVHKLFFGAMKSVQTVRTFDGRRVVVDSFALDMEALSFSFGVRIRST